MTSPDTQAVLAAFHAFKDAVSRADVDAFRAMAVQDRPPQVDLFQANVSRVRAQGWTLRPVRVEQWEDVAELTFEILGRDGKCVDEGRMAFTRESTGWKVRSL